MAHYTCEQCGAPFVREKSGDRPIRFCNSACYQAFRKATGYNMGGTFKPGLEPWNKNLKGIHLSPHSEFKKGCESNRLLPIGSTAIRICKGKKPRRFIKVAMPNKWELNAVYVYEQANGKVKKGNVVHHKDRDSLNDAIGNLQEMTRAEHIEEHRAEHQAAKEAKRDRLRQPGLQLEVA
jgi:hypothetical protein